MGIRTLELVCTLCGFTFTPCGSGGGGGVGAWVGVSVGGHSAQTQVQSDQTSLHNFYYNSQLQNLFSVTAVKPASRKYVAMATTSFHL